MYYILVGILVPFIVFAQVEIPEQSSGIAPEIFKKAHRYHGIKYSKYEEGEWIFYRDGKRCKLFNDKIPKINVK